MTYIIILFEDIFAAILLAVSRQDALAGPSGQSTTCPRLSLPLLCSQSAHGIDAIFKEALYEIIIHSPEDPVQYATDVIQYGAEMARIVSRNHLGAPLWAWHASCAAI